MSLIPEYIIQQVLVKGLRTLRDDGRIVDMLFRNLRQDDLQRVRTFLQESSIDISLNYPDQDLKLPAIVILLKSEAEGQAFVGNLLQSHDSIRDTGHPFPIEELTGDSTVLGRGTVSNIGGGYRVYLEPTTITRADDDAFYIPEGIINIVDPIEEEVYATILEGTGAGQTRQVVVIDPVGIGFDTKITITPVWDTNPDSTSVVRIHSAPDQPGFTGEPSKIFTSQDVLERRGVHYKAIYELLVVGANPESTIFLYSVVKSLLFLNEKFMIEQGFMNLSLSGSDLTPRTEYYPDLAYQRSLSLAFEYSFDVYEKASETSLINKLRVVVSTHHPDDLNPDDIAKSVSDTTIDLT